MLVDVSNKRVHLDRAHNEYMDPCLHIDLRSARRTRGPLPTKRQQHASEETSDGIIWKAHRPQNAIICETDRAKLGSLLDAARRRGTSAREVLDLLEDKLELGKWIPGPSLPADVVVMNSKLKFRDLITGETRHVTLVYPESTVSVRNGVSVLTLLGCELLGLKVGDEIHSVASGTTLWGRIDEVIY